MIKVFGFFILGVTLLNTCNVEDDKDTMNPSDPGSVQYEFYNQSDLSNETPALNLTKLGPQGAILELKNKLSPFHGLSITGAEDATKEEVEFKVKYLATEKLKKKPSLPEGVSLGSRLLFIETTGSKDWNLKRSFDSPLIIKIPLADKDNARQTHYFLMNTDGTLSSLGFLNRTHEFITLFTHSLYDVKNATSNLLSAPSKQKQLALVPLIYTLNNNQKITTLFNPPPETDDEKFKATLSQLKPFHLLTRKILVNTKDLSSTVASRMRMEYLLSSLYITKSPVVIGLYNTEHERYPVLSYAAITIEGSIDTKGNMSITLFDANMPQDYPEEIPLSQIDFKVDSETFEPYTSSIKPDSSSSYKYNHLIQVHGWKF